MDLKPYLISESSYVFCIAGAARQGRCARYHQATPVAQHSHAVHSVWLVKWAPRHCWAKPSTTPVATDAHHQRRAHAGWWVRHQGVAAMKAKPVLA